MQFFDRKYSLQIGDYQTGDGLLINDLQIQFRVRKSVNNKRKVDKCSISIYNLSDESIAYLETEYPVAILSCGYGSEIVRLFYGEVTEVETRKQGTDRVTTIDVTPSFSELTFQVMSELVPENGTVEDVIEIIRKQTSLSKGVYKGANLKTKIIYGYPLSGTPKEMLDLVAEEYRLQWKIEGDALYINDSDSVEIEAKELAPVIKESSGLLERPYFYTGSSRKSSKDDEKKDGVKFRALINPNIVPGSIVKLEYKNTADFYRVEEVEFQGSYREQPWYMECLCSKRPEE